MYNMQDSRLLANTGCEIIHRSTWSFLRHTSLSCSLCLALPALSPRDNSSQVIQCPFTNTQVELVPCLDSYCTLSPPRLQSILQ